MVLEFFKSVISSVVLPWRRWADDTSDPLFLVTAQPVTGPEGLWPTNTCRCTGQNISTEPRHHPPELYPAKGALRKEKWTKTIQSPWEQAVLAACTDAISRFVGQATKHKTCNYPALPINNSFSKPHQAGPLCSWELSTVTRREGGLPLPRPTQSRIPLGVGTWSPLKQLQLFSGFEG